MYTEPAYYEFGYYELLALTWNITDLQIGLNRETRISSWTAQNPPCNE